MRQQPLISVCIPCYNGEPFIGRTLESVLRQTFTDFELVLVDDKSTDGTVSVIRSFRDGRIRLIQNEKNLGLCLNWSRALSQTVGKYVKLLCEDDVLYPECLARQAAVLEDSANSGVVLTVCNRIVIDESDNVVLKPRRGFCSGRVEGTRLIRKSIRLGSNLIGEPAAGLFRRDALKQASFDASNPYLADLALWSELLRHGDAFLDENCLAAFRISRAATSARIGLGQATAFRRFVRDLRQQQQHLIPPAEVFVGSGLSFCWCILRNLFIRIHSVRGASMTVGKPITVSAGRHNCLPAGNEGAAHRNGCFVTTGY